jgi:hypothetical protein
MKTIKELLEEVGEDKHQNLTTTSFKFKTDLWNFFQGFQDKVAIEFGTHKGQTTRIMSHLFKKVHTVNNSDNEKSKELNADRTNIVHHNFNLYSPDKLPVVDIIDVALIDAGHTYAEVIYDINRIISMNCSEECYIVFDDYGSIPDVRKAIDHAISMKYLEEVQEIGHSKGHNFGNGTKGGPDRILAGPEGLITKVIWHE